MSEAGTRPESVQGGPEWAPLQPSLSLETGPGEHYRSAPLKHRPRSQLASGAPGPFSVACGYCCHSQTLHLSVEQGRTPAAWAPGVGPWYCWHASGASRGAEGEGVQDTSPLPPGSAVTLPDWYSWDANGVPESPPKPRRGRQAVVCPGCDAFSSYCWEECCADQARGGHPQALQRAREGAGGAAAGVFLWEEDGRGAATGLADGREGQEGESGADPQDAGASASGIWDNSDVAEEVLSHLPIDSLCSAAMVCRAWKDMADCDMVWRKKLRRVHATSGADRPGPLPFSVGPGRWKALARSLRHFYAQWGYPLQLKGVVATGQSSHHGIFEAHWTLSDMHCWCSRVLRRPETAEESLRYRISDTPDTFVMALEVVPVRKANFVLPKSVTIEVGTSPASYHFCHSFPLDPSPVTNLLKLPQHCSAVGSHVRLTFRGCHPEERAPGPSRLSRATSSRHFCIKRVRFLGVPADVFAEEDLWRAIKVE